MGLRRGRPMTRGKKIVLKGLAIVRAKGREYVYAWRGGPRLTAPVGAPEFMRQYAEAVASRKRLPASDTIAGLILEYRASRAFRTLAPATRKDHERAFPLIIREFGAAPVAAFADPRIRKDIRQWHERFAHDRQADKILGTLSRLLSFAVEDGQLTANPAIHVPNRYRRAPDPTPVSEADLEKVLGHEETPEPVARAIRLMARSGLARADAATLLWSHVKVDRIDKRRVKSKQRASPPMTPELAEVLAAMPRHKGVLTVLTTSEGKPWRDADALGKAISAALKAAGVDHTPHDLRATYACFLMRKGATDEEAAEALGWSLDTVRQVRRHYVDDEAIFQGRIAKFSDEKTKREQ